MERWELKLILGGVIVGLAAGFLAARSFYQGGDEIVRQPNVMGPAAPGGAPAGAPPTMNQQQEQIHQQIQGLLSRIEADPNDRESRVALGNITMDNGLFDMAAKFYGQALALDDKDPNVLTDLGIVHRRLQDSAKAVELFEKAVALNPGHVQGWYNIAVVKNADFNDSAGAKEALERALAADPDFPVDPELRKQLLGS